MNEKEIFHMNDKNLSNWWSEYKNKNIKNLKSAKLPSFKHGSNILIEPTFKFNELSSKILSKNNIKITADKKEVKIVNGICDDIIEFLEEKWEDQHSDNWVWYFHNLFSNNCTFIYIPKHITANINIERIIDKDNVLISLFILADIGSKARIIFNKNGKETANYSSELVRIIAKEDSFIELICTQKLPKGLTFFQNRKSIGDTNSEINWLDIFIGGEYIRSETTSYLNNRLARVKNILLYFAQNNQKNDFYNSAIHNFSETKSDLIVKGALVDQAKALSRSLIKIMPSASNSKGCEKQEAIILGSKAEADAIPHLEVENSNVKCSHSSTIGKIDNDKMFYLMSRGLKETEAINLVVQGFMEPVVKTLPLEYAVELNRLIQLEMTGSVG